MRASSGPTTSRSRGPTIERTDEDSGRRAGGGSGARAARAGHRGGHRSARPDAAGLRVPAAERPAARPRATSTSPPPRSAAASCGPADEVGGPRVPRAAESATARWSGRVASTARSPRSERRHFEDLTPAPPTGACSCAGRWPGSAGARPSTCSRPLAFGQRVLVLAQPRSGRTTLLRALGSAIAETGAQLIVLLADERPEEVTAVAKALPAGRDLRRDCRPGADATRPATPSWRWATRSAWPRPGRRRRPDRLALSGSRSATATRRGSSASSAPAASWPRKGPGSLTVIATVLDQRRSGDGDARGAGDDREPARCASTPTSPPRESPLRWSSPTAARPARRPAARSRGDGEGPHASRRARRDGARGGRARLCASRSERPRTTRSCSAAYSGRATRWAPSSCGSGVARPRRGPAAVGDAAPGGLGGELDQLGVAIGLDVAEGLRRARRRRCRARPP